MASDILHIKDGYYFDVPKSMWKARHQSAAEFRDQVGAWFVRNDDEYQNWEAEQIVHELNNIGIEGSHTEDLISKWHTWQHSTEARHGRPLDRYIEERIASMEAKAKVWAKTKAPGATKPLLAYLAENPKEPDAWMASLATDESKAVKWKALQRDMDAPKLVDDFVTNHEWSAEKIAAYNKYVSGKIFIPQPFGTIKNAYERESGFAISKFMIIEVVVAIFMFLAFTWLAGKISSGSAPKGKRWNLLESFLVFIRNDVVLPGMGEHDTDRFMPFFWTVFMFILGCNLMGMLPWVGAPSAALGMTAALALIVFFLGLFLGIRKFGVFGYLKNLMPSLGLPIYLAVVIVPMVWVIEFASLFIKHGILAIRLLANMVAGHMVLLGILGLAVGAEAVTMGMAQWSALQ